MKTYCGVEVLIHAFLISMMDVICQLYAPATLSPGKEPLVHIGKEAGCGEEKKIPAPAGN
jgi:hypothetical protein